MPGPINRASIKPQTHDFGFRERSDITTSANESLVATTAEPSTSQRYQSHIRRPLVVDARCHSRVMRDVSARQRQGCLTLEGQPTLPLSTLSVRYIAGSPSVFGILVGSSVKGGMGKEGQNDGIPIKACNANSLAALGEHIARLLFMPHPKHSPRIRVTPTPSAPFSPQSYQTLPWRYAFERLACHLSREGAVIPADKSSDVISRRQQISRRLNVSREGERPAISLCSTIYISHPRVSRVKSSSSLLDKMYIIDLSFHREEDNMQRNINAISMIF